VSPDGAKEKEKKGKQAPAQYVEKDKKEKIYSRLECV